MSQTPITLSDARRIYRGLGFSDANLQEEITQANLYGMQPEYWTQRGLKPQSPRELAEGYARDYRREQGCQDADDRRFVEMAYGTD